MHGRIVSPPCCRLAGWTWPAPCALHRRGAVLVVCVSVSSQRLARARLLLLGGDMMGVLAVRPVGGRRVLCRASSARPGRERPAAARAGQHAVARANRAAGADRHQPRLPAGRWRSAGYLREAVQPAAARAAAPSGAESSWRSCCARLAAEPALGLVAAARPVAPGRRAVRWQRTMRPAPRTDACRWRPLLAFWIAALFLATGWRNRIFGETRVRLEARNTVDPLTGLATPLVLSERVRDRAPPDRAATATPAC